jgi:hypothetical protein
MVSLPNPDTTLGQVLVDYYLKFFRNAISLLRGVSWLTEAVKLIYPADNADKRRKCQYCQRLCVLTNLNIVLQYINVSTG